MPNLKAGMGLLAALAGGLGLYNYLSGRDLLRDRRDELKLAALSLAEGSALWARNPCQSDLIICLTTTPSRLPYLAGTLKSLLRQTRRPQRLRLHLPEFSRREGRAYPELGALAALPAVEVVRCEDLGPATKLLPALAAFPADQPLLVVDDDMLYPADFVENFHRWAAAWPGLAVGSSGWRVPEDLTDRPTTLLSNLRQTPPTPLKSTRIKTPTRVDILQGYSGYLVRPRFFDLDAVFHYAAAPPAAFFQDDVWFSAHCTAPKYVFPAGRYPFQAWRRLRLYQATSISRLNRGGGDPEQRVNTILIRHFRGRWLCAQPPAAAGHRSANAAGNCSKPPYTSW